MAAALLPDERAALPIALAGVMANLAVADPDDGGADERDQILTQELMQAITNMKPEMGEVGRADWVSSQMADLDREPYELVLEAVRLVRRSCRYPGDFLPNVIAHILTRKARLEAEAERYEELMRAAA